VHESVASLEKRRGMLDYAWFQARGYPIGSGAVESANQLVVEARRKGAGRPWARPHINPMVALRTIACSDRWEEAWPQIAQHIRHQGWHRRLQHQAGRRRLTPSAPMTAPPTSGPATGTTGHPVTADPHPAGRTLSAATHGSPRTQRALPPTAASPLATLPQWSGQTSATSSPRSRKTLTDTPQ
jgi:hypothetical protein